MIDIYDIDNNVIKCELLFTFCNGDKKFVVYKDKDEEILASFYKEENNKIIIEPIIDDYYYDIVDQELEKWWNKNE